MPTYDYNPFEHSNCCKLAGESVPVCADGFEVWKPSKPLKCNDNQGEAFFCKRNNKVHGGCGRAFKRVEQGVTGNTIPKYDVAFLDPESGDASLASCSKKCEAKGSEWTMACPTNIEEYSALSSEFLYQKYRKHEKNIEYIDSLDFAYVGAYHNEPGSKYAAEEAMCTKKGTKKRK